MGKKGKSSGIGKRIKPNRKNVDLSDMPPPAPAIQDELGSMKLLTEPRAPGSNNKALDKDGYDDGGVADLTMVIDLEDYVLRRKRGEKDYFTAAKTDTLPRMTDGQFANVNRREQKIQLAHTLFTEDDADDVHNNSTASEVYVEKKMDEEEDEATKKMLYERLRAAKFALKLSTVMREPACAALSLAEISKRYLNCYGKAGAEDALRCAQKSIDIASDQYYDNDEIVVESEEKPLFKPHEKNATYPGLAHESSLKYMPLRVSHVCLRSSLLHAGNALSALGRDEEARVEYSKALPILANEPRAARLDSERASFYVNIGNTYSRQGNVEKADENYTIAEKLGQDHMDAGNKRDGLGVVVVAKRARAFCFNRNGREEEGKALLREVLKLNLELDVEMEKYKEEMKKVEAKQVEEQQQQAAKAAAANKAPAIAAADAADPAKAID